MQSRLNSNERIFIAGSSGMVGSAIKRALIKKGYCYNSSLGILLTPTRKELDLRNFYDLKKWFEINKPSIVILAAAKVGGIYANNNKPFEFILENLKIQTNIIELSWHFGVKTLLFLGSSCIYPKFAPQPIKEEYLMTGSLEKTNEFYALAKIAGIKLCESIRIQHKFNSICLMPTNLYGPGDNYHKLNSHFIPALLRKIYQIERSNNNIIKIWGDGSPRREIIYSEDIADACIFFMNKKTKHSLINIGTGNDFRIKEYVSLFLKILLPKRKIKIVYDRSKPNGTPRKVLDVSLAKKYGWTAKTSIKEAVFKTYDEYKYSQK